MKDLKLIKETFNPPSNSKKRKLEKILALIDTHPEDLREIEGRKYLDYDTVAKLDSEQKILKKHEVICFILEKITSSCKKCGREIRRLNGIAISRDFSHFDSDPWMGCKHCKYSHGTGPVAREMLVQAIEGKILYYQSDAQSPL